MAPKKEKPTVKATPTKKDSFESIIDSESKSFNNESKNRSSNISSLSATLSKHQNTTNKTMQSITKSISSIAKDQSNTTKQLRVREVGYSKGIKEVEKSMNVIMKKLGYTINEFGRGAKKIAAQTAVATKETLKQYSRAIGEDISVNKQNMVGMALSQASPIFGYFASKFMETNVFQKAKERMKQSLANVFSVVGMKIKEWWTKGKEKGREGIDKVKTKWKERKDIKEQSKKIKIEKTDNKPPKKIPHLAQGGLVTKPGLARIHAAEVVAPVDKLFDKFGKIFEPFSDSLKDFSTSTTREIRKLRFALVGMGREISSGIMETLTKSSAFRTMFTSFNMLKKGIISPLKFLFRPRGSYFSHIPRSGNVLANMASTLGLIYSTTQPKLDAMLLVLRNIGEALTGKKQKGVQNKTWTMFERGKDFLQGKNKEKWRKQSLDDVTSSMGLDKNALEKSGLAEFFRNMMNIKSKEDVMGLKDKAGEKLKGVGAAALGKFDSLKETGMGRANDIKRKIPSKDEIIERIKKFYGDISLDKLKINISDGTVTLKDQATLQYEKLLANEKIKQLKIQAKEGLDRLRNKGEEGIESVKHGFSQLGNKDYRRWKKQQFKGNIKEGIYQSKKKLEEGYGKGKDHISGKYDQFNENESVVNAKDKSKKFIHDKITGVSGAGLVDAAKGIGNAVLAVTVKLPFAVLTKTISASIRTTLMLGRGISKLTKGIFNVSKWLVKLPFRALMKTISGLGAGLSKITTSFISVGTGIVSGYRGMKNKISKEGGLWDAAKSAGKDFWGKASEDEISSGSVDVAAIDAKEKKKTGVEGELQKIGHSIRAFHGSVSKDWAEAEVSKNKKDTTLKGSWRRMLSSLKDSKENVKKQLATSRDTLGLTKKAEKTNKKLLQNSDDNVRILNKIRKQAEDKTILMILMGLGATITSLFGKMFGFLGKLPLIARLLGAAKGLPGLGGAARAGAGTGAAGGTAAKPGLFNKGTAAKGKYGGTGVRAGGIGGMGMGGGMSLAGGAIGGVMSGMEVGAERGAASGIAQGMISGSLSTIGGMVLGPVGTIVGKMLGDAVGKAAFGLGDWMAKNFNIFMLVEDYILTPIANAFKNMTSWMSDLPNRMIEWITSKVPDWAKKIIGISEKPVATKGQETAAAIEKDPEAAYQAAVAARKKASEGQRGDSNPEDAAQKLEILLDNPDQIMEQETKRKKNVLGSATPDRIANFLDDLKDSDTDTLEEGTKVKMLDTRAFPGQNSENAKKYGINAPGGAHIEKINPGMYKALIGMGEEYKQKTGKEITVTDGYRSMEQQMKLYKEKPGLAAPPGRSMHQFGVALDVGTNTGNELGNMGLLEKYGFARPMYPGKPGGKVEPWHIEPAAIQGKYADVRSGNLAGIGKDYDISQFVTGATEFTAESVKPGSFGWLSRMFESGEAGPGTVSSGAGDAGGKSYGAYQFASNRGVVTDFLRSSGYSGKFNSQVGSSEFDAKWRELAKTDPKFGEAQNEYIKQKYLTPYLDRIKSSTGFDLATRAPVLVEEALSTSVQYGPGSGIVPNALKGLPQNVSDADILTKIGQTKMAGLETNFRSSSPAVRAGVGNRINREISVALGQIGGISNSQMASNIPKNQRGDSIDNKNFFNLPKDIKDVVSNPIMDKTKIANNQSNEQTRQTESLIESINSLNKTTADFLDKNQKQNTAIINNVTSSISASMSSSMNSVANAMNNNRSSNKAISDVLSGNMI